jgi:dynein regulatory complex subunit 2
MEAERNNSRINNLKIRNQWRKIMRLAKTEALKKDIEILSQNHERDIDRKDAILQMLDRDLEEAEDQYQMALRLHLQNMDSLIQLHDNRLYALERNFQEELKQLQEDVDTDKTIIMGKFNNEKHELRMVIEAIDDEEDGKDTEAKHSFEQLREEIRNRSLEEINMLRISLDAQIEELENHFETAHLNYLQQTAQRTHDFKELTQTDQRLSKDIEVKRKKIDVLQTSIQQWRAKTRQLSRETEERNRLLKEEKHTIQKHYQQLKQRISSYRGTQNQRLLQLSQNASESKAKLNRKLDLARRLLNATGLIRKLETEQEKVLPFGSIDGEEEAAQDAGDGSTTGGSKSTMDKSATPYVSNPMQTRVLDSTGAVVAPPERLKNFHKKYNKILLQCIAIEGERDRLSTENKQLEDLIEQFMNGMQINDDILSADNPLFVVNGRSNLNHVPPVRTEGPAVQDATQINAIATRQNAPRMM